jgi:catechol-2,3-dioxygenase
MINRLNHAVLYVRDAERSAKFYEENLGFKRIDAYGSIPNGAFMRAAGSTNDHDLALFGIGEAAADSPAGRTTVGLYHLAWEVDTLADLAAFSEKLSAAGALVGATDHGTTRAVYAKDPDGIEFELTWIIPRDLLTDTDTPAMRPLNLQADIDRFGAETISGVGISRPASVS